MMMGTCKRCLYALCAAQDILSQDLSSYCLTGHANMKSLEPDEAHLGVTTQSLDAGQQYQAAFAKATRYSH